MTTPHTNTGFQFHTPACVDITTLTIFVNALRPSLYDCVHLPPRFSWKDVYTEACKDPEKYANIIEYYTSKDENKNLGGDTTK